MMLGAGERLARPPNSWSSHCETVETSALNASRFLIVFPVAAVVVERLGRMGLFLVGEQSN